MKPEHNYERRQSAGRMEAVMLIASVFGTITAILMVLNYGWLPGLAVFLLSLIVFALSRVFDLLGDVLGSICRVEESIKQRSSKNEEDAS
jgi:hypothetical protein